jgi:hypothetical protein
MPSMRSWSHQPVPDQRARAVDQRCWCAEQHGPATAFQWLAQLRDSRLHQKQRGVVLSRVASYIAWIVSDSAPVLRPAQPIWDVGHDKVEPLAGEGILDQSVRHCDLVGPIAKEGVRPGDGDGLGIDVLAVNRQRCVRSRFSSGNQQTRGPARGVVHRAATVACWRMP